MHPHLRTEPALGPTSTIATPVERLDLATVIKVSQAVSGKMAPEKLIDTLMRTALEQAGAERGLLILSRAAGPEIEAEATTSGDTVSVHLRTERVTASMLAEAVLHYVLRSRESVILDDAAAKSLFADDPYIQEREARSILCLPLINQAKLIGALYLENNLTRRAFAPARIAVLKLLASQAATALENARLYRDLEQREAKIRGLVDANIIGICVVEGDRRILEANEAFLCLVGYDRDDLLSGLINWMDLTPPAWRDRSAQAASELTTTGAVQPFEKEYIRKDGSRVPVLVGAARIGGSEHQHVSFMLDLTERKRAEAEVRDSERRYAAVQAELAHANRVATMGQLTVSIAHEVNQPIAAAVINAQAALRWLRAERPDIEGARRALGRILENGNRARSSVGFVPSSRKRLRGRMPWRSMTRSWKSSP
jgi:PAS domain S-box-containing protein